MTLRRRLVDWSLTGFLILLPALVLRASLSRGTPSALDQALLRITAPLETGVSWVVEGIGGTWSRYVALVDIEAENRELRDDNERLRKELAAMTRKAYDVAALEDLAVVKKRTPADTLGARVIGAPLSPQFRVLRLKIDRGDREVATDMPVITSEGPVGRVDKVYGDYADVVLISDPSSRIDIVIRDPDQPAAPSNGARGLLVGMGRPDSYACKIEWLERQGHPGAQPTADTKVKIGDEIVTSGLGASFPAGLVVGKISKIIGDDGMFQSVEVNPTVDVSRVRAVMVLLAPPPPPDPDAKARRRSDLAFGARPL
ncbi:MAG TPA: rod shape-determining protein MreC [Kofleriaceae bacterium]|jgi:rod shape-determining protein MreC|nr:rod shape-determining protein MreC [Kofleriaceae bacterium]